MKKVLIIAAIAVIAACHLMHEDTHGSAKNPGSIRGFSFTF